LRGGEEALQLEEKGKCDQVCSGTSSQKRETRVEKGRATVGLWIAARWRPASTPRAPWRTEKEIAGRSYGGGQG
jgi:hypothetical protein